MAIIDIINKRLIQFIKWILIVFGTAMTILVIVNVILRYVFNTGLTWSEEASRFLFIWTTFMGSILAAYNHKHMRLDLIVEKLPKSVSKVVQLIAYLITIVLLFWLVTGGISVIQTSWSMPTAALKIPKGLVYLGAPICFGYMILQCISDIIKLFISKKEETA